MSFVEHRDLTYAILCPLLFFRHPRSLEFQFRMGKDHFSLLLAFQDREVELCPVFRNSTDLLSTRDRGQVALWILVTLTCTPNTIKTYLSTLVEMESILWSNGKSTKEVI